METQRILLESISLDDLATAVAGKINFSAPIEQPTILDVKQTALFLRLSIPTVWRLKNNGELPYRKIGGRVVFIREELLKWISK